jgi:hypothetical protein
MVNDYEEVDAAQTESSRPLSGLLTPRATAIAAFAFAVFSMQGQGTWSQALQTLFWGAGQYPESRVLSVFVTWGLATLLLAVVAGLLALHTLRDAVASTTWEGSLARAAVLVASAGALLSLIGILAGLVRHSI